MKGGGAWTSSTYNLNSNTSVLALGTGSTGITAWGWTVGGGIEYALTKWIDVVKLGVNYEFDRNPLAANF